MLGYLFIIVFVVAGGWLAFNTQFFTDNEPNLDQLSKWYPALMLFFIPTITMSVWAEERKSGTDELLFTMPATDLEILLGKYISVLAVYTVALLFSGTYVLMLSALGNPDRGLLSATYFGYWIAGAALLAAGMLASLLTNNMTVAFVLGIVVCSIPVFIGKIGEVLCAIPGVGRIPSYFRVDDVLNQFGIEEQFRDLSIGVIPLTSIVYFVGFTILMLYLNLVLLSKRHWKSNEKMS